MIPPKPLSSKVWVSARDWQEIGERGRAAALSLCLKKQRARYDIECDDFGLAGGTVGWARTTTPVSTAEPGWRGIASGRQLGTENPRSASRSEIINCVVT